MFSVPYGTKNLGNLGQGFGQGNGHENKQGILESLKDRQCRFPATPRVDRLEGMVLRHFLCWAKELKKMKEDPLIWVRSLLRLV